MDYVARTELRFDPEYLTAEDHNIAMTLLGSEDRISRPDLLIAPFGEPYLYRWYVVPHNSFGEVCFHVQVDDDPERPLHDHPWDNTSVILSGGYREVMATHFNGRVGNPETYHRVKGDVVHRRAETAHRLFMPDFTPYTMTLFSTGPHRREWGFWFPSGWHHNKEVIELLPDGRSIFKDIEHDRHHSFPRL